MRNERPFEESPYTQVNHRFGIASDAAFEELDATAADEDRRVVDAAREIVEHLGQ